MSIPIWGLLRLFLVIKLTQTLIIYFTPCQFDTSSQLIISQLPQSPFPTVINTILDKLIVWDSVYFNALFIRPAKYEQEFVFCPGWIAFIRSFPLENYYALQLLSILISNVCHFASAILIYAITREMYDAKISELSSVFLIMGPTAGAFLVTNYSENVSNFLTLLCFYFYFTSINFQDYSKTSNKTIISPVKYVLSGIVASLGFTVRANGLLLGIIYVIDLYHFFIDQNMNEIILTLTTGSSLFIALVSTNAYHYFKFCPGRGEWCNSYFPSLFKYAQDRYWNVGFLKYWTPNNIPNFLIVGPAIVINIYSTWYIYKREVPKNKRILVLVIIHCIILFSGILFWNIQILNRVTSYSPIVYWMLSLHFIDHKKKKIAEYTVIYGLVWNVIQTALFAAFLPPA
ncbi:GPI mannosyltransferase 2 [Spathaspora sp. JA1]|nr:GPI mannosyltransferase 2 [Spathaspora sp. JA1]